MSGSWDLVEAQGIFNLPFNDLLFAAHKIFRRNFDPNKLQASTLLSIKTGSCPENCSYCPQSAHYNSPSGKHPLMSEEEVAERADKAKKLGATRFCIGAAWRGPKQNDLNKVCSMIAKIKSMGLETCASLGLLNADQALQLKDSGLDYYNHNIDTSPQYYNKIITTRTFKSRIDTLKNVRSAGVKICCGGILGMGETTDDRLEMIVLLANLPDPPESFPINKLIPIPGTPMENMEPLDSFSFIRTVATSRIMLPKSYIRLSAGRHNMSDEMQALCFFAGANSIFYGDTLLTAPNSDMKRDNTLLAKLGMKFYDINANAELQN